MGWEMRVGEGQGWRSRVKRGEPEKHFTQISFSHFAFQGAGTQDSLLKNKKGSECLEGEGEEAAVDRRTVTEFSQYSQFQNDWAALVPKQVCQSRGLNHCLCGEGGSKYCLFQSHGVEPHHSVVSS